MERIQKIFKHPLYRENFYKLQEAEKDRKYCRHDLSHFMDVARISYIYSLEEGEDVDKVLIYAAALLHDIGRARQLEEGIPHEAAGAELAEEILEAVGFNEEHVSLITKAIALHRNADENFPSKLAEYIYRADKASRKCYCCKAAEDCKWEHDRRNREIYI